MFPIPMFLLSPLLMMVPIFISVPRTPITVKFIVSNMRKFVCPYPIIRWQPQENGWGSNRQPYSSIGRRPIPISTMRTIPETIIKKDICANNTWTKVDICAGKNN
jgi:hypothetical protein